MKQEDLASSERAYVTSGGERGMTVGKDAGLRAVTTDDQETDSTPEELARLTEAYLQCVEERWSRLEVGDTYLPLSDLSLDPERLATPAAPNPWDSQAPWTPPSRLSLGKALEKDLRLVIVDEPGTGKTTTLHYIALCFACRQQGNRTAWHAKRLGIVHPYVPILLSLQTHAGSIATAATLADVLVGEIRSHLPDVTKSQAHALLTYWRRSDGLLVLLDNLDEVPQAQSTAYEKIARYQGEGIRMIVTSRPAGFTALDGFRQYTLEPLNEDDVLAYLTFWLRSLTGWTEQHAREQAGCLREQMRQHKYMWRLLNNPLLLRLSAEHFSRTGEAAHSRSDLYHSWVEQAWQRALVRGADQAQKETALLGLEALAWHCQAGGDNEQETLFQALLQFRVVATQREGESLLTVLSEKVGLLTLDIEHTDVDDIRHYLFAHQTLCDYFVARRLQRAWGQNATRTRRFLKPRLHLMKWREPLMLLGGVLTEQEETRLIAWVQHAHSPYERQLKRDLLLAAGMAAEVGHSSLTDLLSAIIAPLRKNRNKTVLPYLAWQAMAALRGGIFGETRVNGVLWYLTRQATTALKQIGPQALPAMLEVLVHDKNVDMRSLAAEVIGQIGDSQVVPALCLALRDPDQQVRQSAAWALGEIGDLEAVPTLLRALQDETGEYNLPELNLTDEDETEYWREAVVRALGRLSDPLVVPILRETALRDQDYGVRETATEALIRIGDPEAAPAFLQALHDIDPDVRKAAAQALGQIGATEAVPALCEAVRDNDQWVRHMAAVMLGKIGNPQAVPALLLALQDLRPNVCQAAVEALGEIGDPQAVPALLQALQDEDPWMVRSEAAKALGKIGDPRAVPALLQALQGQDRWVRSEAAKALGKIGDPQALPALLQALQGQDRWVRADVAKALGKIGDPQVVPALRTALRSNDADVRQAAALALGQMDDPQSVAVLRAALQDKKAVARRAAAMALVAMGQVGDPEIVPVLRQVLRDRDWSRREDAAEALQTILPAFGATSFNTPARLQSSLSRLARTAAGVQEYDLLAVILQLQAAWRIRHSPWQDPLLSPPFLARLQ